jgi:hypothetical protein
LVKRKVYWMGDLQMALIILQGAGRETGRVVFC